MSDPSTPPSSGSSPRSSGGPWRTVGIVLAVLLAIAGMAVVGLFILFVIAMNSYGSNK